MHYTETLTFANFQILQNTKLDILIFDIYNRKNPCYQWVAQKKLLINFVLNLNQKLFFCDLLKLPLSLKYCL